MNTIVLRKSKNTLLAILLPTFLLLMGSCEKDHFNSYGFQSDFGGNSSGLTIMSIGNNTTFIRLSGNILMDKGEMKVEFIDPEGYMVFTQNFYAPGNYFIDETFKATHGVWKLRYTSLEGSGSIDLHADF